MAHIDVSVNPNAIPDGRFPAAVKVDEGKLSLDQALGTDLFNAAIECPAVVKGRRVVDGGDFFCNECEVKHGVEAYNSEGHALKFLCHVAGEKVISTASVVPIPAAEDEWPADTPDWMKHTNDGG